MKHFLHLLMLIFTSFLQMQAQSVEQGEKPAKKQNQFDYIQVSFTNTHVTMPFGSFSSLLYKTVHPGVEIGTGFNWSAKKKHDWLQTFKLGYTYHQFVQHAVMIYTELGYKYKFPKGFAALTKLGAGYLHSIEDSKVYVLNGKGEYIESKKFGRSHAMATFSIGISKQVGKKGWLLLMDYQQRMQFSFIPAYVPALPCNSFVLGVSIPFKK